MKELAPLIGPYYSTHISTDMQSDYFLFEIRVFKTFLSFLRAVYHLKGIYGLFILQHDSVRVQEGSRT